MVCMAEVMLAIEKTYMNPSTVAYVNHMTLNM